MKILSGESNTGYLYSPISVLLYKCSIHEIGKTNNYDNFILRRRWSSLFSHLETMKKDRLVKGSESTHNCPLVATLKMFYSSACSANKNAGGEEGSGGEREDGCSSNDEDYELE